MWASENRALQLRHIDRVSFGSTCGRFDTFYVTADVSITTEQFNFLAQQADKVGTIMNLQVEHQTPPHVTLLGPIKVYDRDLSKKIKVVFDTMKNKLTSWSMTAERIKSRASAEPGYALFGKDPMWYVASLAANRAAYTYLFDTFQVAIGYALKKEIQYDIDRNTGELVFFNVPRRHVCTLPGYQHPDMYHAHVSIYKLKAIGNPPEALSDEQRESILNKIYKTIGKRPNGGSLMPETYDIRGNDMFISKRKVVTVGGNKKSVYKRI